MAYNVPNINNNPASGSPLTNQSSPIIRVQGNYWDGFVSVPDVWTIQNVNATGLQIKHEGNPAGGGALVWDQVTTSTTPPSPFMIVQSVEGAASVADSSLVLTLPKAVTQGNTLLLTLDTAPNPPTSFLDNQGNTYTLVNSLVHPSTQLVSDIFHRADSGTLGSPWTFLNSADAGLVFGIVSNQAQPETQDATHIGGDFYTGVIWPNDQYSEVVVGTLSNIAGVYIGPIVRAQGGVGTGNGDCYGFAFAATGTAFLQKYTNSIGVTLASGSFSFVSGDVVRLTVVGTTLTVTKNGVSILTASDATYASGSAGILYFNTSPGAQNEGTIASWNGGNAASSSESLYLYVVEFPVAALTTLTIELNASIALAQLYEVAGIVEILSPLTSPVDGTGTQFTASSLTPSAGTLTTSFTPDVIFSVLSSNNSQTLTPVGGYTVIDSQTYSGSRFAQQGTAQSAPGSPTVSFSFQKDVTEGNTILIGFGSLEQQNINPTVVSVRDTLGNVYALIESASGVYNGGGGNNFYTNLWVYAAPVTVPGACTVIVETSGVAGSTPFVQLVCTETNGIVSTPDRVASDFALHPTTFNTGTITTTHANDTIWSFVLSHGSSFQPAGYTLGPSIGSGIPSLASAFLNVSSVGTFSPTWSTPLGDGAAGVTASFQIVTPATYELATAILPVLTTGTFTSNWTSATAATTLGIVAGFRVSTPTPVPGATINTLDFVMPDGLTGLSGTATGTPANSIGTVSLSASSGDGINSTSIVVSGLGTPYTFYWPTTPGQPGQVLAFGVNGQASWSAAGGLTRLDQILNPTASKTFNLGGHSLEILAGSGTPQPFAFDNAVATSGNGTNATISGAPRAVNEWALIFAVPGQVNFDTSYSIISNSNNLLVVNKSLPTADPITFPTGPFTADDWSSLIAFFTSTPTILQTRDYYNIGNNEPNPFTIGGGQPAFNNTTQIGSTILVLVASNVGANQGYIFPGGTTIPLTHCDNAITSGSPPATTTTYYGTFPTTFAIGLVVEVRGFEDAFVTGAVTSGAFVPRETVVEQNGGAVAVLFGTPPTGIENLNIEITLANYNIASANFFGGDTWIGQTSGAVYTSTAAPVWYNNGDFQVVSNTGTTLVLDNPNGVAENPSLDSPPTTAEVITGTIISDTKNNDYVAVASTAGVGGTHPSYLILYMAQNATPLIDEVSPVIFTGVGLNDLSTSGLPTASASFVVTIDSTGTPDTFTWTLNGVTQTTLVPITGALQFLTDGVSIVFASTTGHTLGDHWTFSSTVDSISLFTPSLAVPTTQFEGIHFYELNTGISTIELQAAGGTLLSTYGPNNLAPGGLNGPILSLLLPNPGGIQTTGFLAQSNETTPTSGVYESTASLTAQSDTGQTASVVVEGHTGAGGNVALFLDNVNGTFLTDSSGSGILIAVETTFSPSGFVHISNDGSNGSFMEDTGGGGITISASGVSSFLNFTNTGFGGIVFEDTSPPPFGFSITENGSGGIAISNRGTGGTTIADSGGTGITVENVAITGYLHIANSGNAGTTISDSGGGGIFIDETTGAGVVIHGATPGGVKIEDSGFNYIQVSDSTGITILNAVTGLITVTGSTINVHGGSGGINLTNISGSITLDATGGGNILSLNPGGNTISAGGPVLFTTGTSIVESGAVLTFSGVGSPPAEGEINANFLYGVQISGTPPTSGQVLTATSSTSAAWQTSSGGGGIGGTIAANQIAFGTAPNTIGGSADLTWTSGVFAATTSGVSGFTVSDNSSSGGLTLQESGSGGLNITNTGTGDLGITNSSSTGNLTIAHTTGSGAIIVKYDAAATGSGINLENDAASGGISLLNNTTSGSGGGLAIQDNSTVGVFITNTNTAGVAIDTTFSGGTGPLALTVTANPTNTAGVGLTINGSTGYTHTSSDYTAFTFVNGIVTAATPSSDERVKKYIKPFTTGLEAILAINPITYWWDAEKSGIVSDHEWVGFSAQNVQKVIPVATPVDPQTGYLEFNDKGVIAALVNAVKELAAENAALKARLTTLENK